MQLHSHPRISEMANWKIHFLQTLHVPRQIKWRTFSSSGHHYFSIGSSIKINIDSAIKTNPGWTSLDSWILGRPEPLHKSYSKMLILTFCVDFQSVHLI